MLDLILYFYHITGYVILAILYLIIVVDKDYLLEKCEKCEKCIAKVTNDYNFWHTCFYAHNISTLNYLVCKTIFKVYILFV